MVLAVEIWQLYSGGIVDSTTTANQEIGVTDGCGSLPTRKLRGNFASTLL